jgi:hypothetical protein
VTSVKYDPPLREFGCLGIRRAKVEDVDLMTQFTESDRNVLELAFSPSAVQSADH